MAVPFLTPIDLNGSEILNAEVQQLGADPSSPGEGRYYWNTGTKRWRVHNGTTWLDLATTVDTGAGIPASIVDAKGDLIVATAADTVARKAVGADGTLLVANSADGSGLNWRTLLSADLPNSGVTYAKIQDVSATQRVLGRGTAAAGPVEELTVGGGIEFNALQLRTSAFTGDVTKAAGGTATTIANDVVTYAKMQNVSATDRLLGRDTAAAGDVEELTVGGGIEFTGTGGIQRSALTGDITATAGSNATAIAAGVIVNADVNASAAIARSKLDFGSGLVNADIATAAAIAATKIAFTPAQGIAATDVQAAIEETVTDLTALINSTVEGRTWKDPVDAATTAALPSLTYNSGAGTLTATANAALPAQDGVTLAVGDDLLVKDQASTFQNGIYTVTQVGSGAAPFILTRRADGSTATELRDATLVVEGGTVNKGDIYTQTTSTLADLTSATQTWSKTGEGNTVYTDGAGLTLTGQDFSVNVGAGLEISSDAVRIAAAAAGSGLTGGAGTALAVGAGTGITVNADDVAVNTSVVVRKAAADCAAATTTTVTHNFGTRDVTVQVYRTTTPWEEVIVDVERPNTNDVLVRFAVAPTAGQYRIVVHG